MNSNPISILAVLLLTGLGWAFTEVAKDKSGDISISESIAVSGLFEQMTVLDKNKHGRLSAEEYTAMESLPAGSSEPKARMH